MNGPAFPTGRHAPPSSGGPATAPTTATAPTIAGAAKSGFHAFGTDGFSFGDVLDIINPLQHIPVISTIYRKMTGDTLDPLPRVAGGTLFGGIAGAVSAVVNLAVKAASGRDIGATALAFVENGLGLSINGPGDGPGDDPLNAPAAMIADAAGAPRPAFNAGWQAAAAMQYSDAERLDPKRSFFTDAVNIAAAALDAATLAAANVESDQAAARYAEATALAAATAPRLDMHG